MMRRGDLPPGVRIAFVADPDGNLVELLSSDEEAPPT
jgi:catechol 2,3-dioxygenase-like lactoylglutathione lyase family enzyme